MRKKNKIQTENGYLYRCSSCNLYLPANKFCNNKSLTYRDGVNSICKECQRVKENSYRKNLNPEDSLRLKLKHCLSSAKSRAKYSKLDFNLTEDYIKYLQDTQKGLCAISGIPMTSNYGTGVIETNASIDRIDSSRGYVIGNVQLTCWAINRMKGPMNLEQLLYFCKNVINNNFTSASNVEILNKEKQKEANRLSA